MVSQRANLPQGEKEGQHMYAETPEETTAGGPLYTLSSSSVCKFHSFISIQFAIWPETRFALRGLQYTSLEKYLVVVSQYCSA